MSKRWAVGHACILGLMSLGWTAEVSALKIVPAVSCASQLGDAAYAGKTVVVDANVLMHDAEALMKFPGAHIILPAGILEELDNNKGHRNIGHNVRQVFRTLAALSEQLYDHKTIDLGNGSTLSLDVRDHSRRLRHYDFDRKKVDNTAYLSLSLAYQARRHDVILVTDDRALQVKAAAVGIRFERFRHKDKARPTATEGDGALAQMEITDAEMKTLLAKNQIPLPKALPIVPNEFIQFVSPGHALPNRAAIARFVFKRPVEIFHAKLNAAQLSSGTLTLDQSPMVGTVRVSVDHEPVRDGWAWDDGTNTLSFDEPTRRRLNPESLIVVEGQTEPHRMQRLLSLRELGFWNLESRSLEQTMVLNLGIDPSIDCLVQEGSAGSSKTFNYVALVLYLLERDRQNRWAPYVTRPPAYLGGHNPGPTPGDLLEKNMDFLQPYLDSITAVRAAKEFGGQKSKSVALETVLPANWNFLAYQTIRGRSVPNALIGVDEFQNTAESDAKTVLTRGSGTTRFFISGDVTQVDPPLTPGTNGLAHLISWLSDPEISFEERSRFGYVKLRRGVRSPFSQTVLDLADRHQRR